MNGIHGHQSTEQVKADALREQERRQCASGRHQRTCPHRAQQGGKGR